jgi:predicted transcriptional regulator
VEEAGNNPQTITVHLRADQTLNPKTAKALAQLIQLAYTAIEQGELEEDEE